MRLCANAEKKRITRPGELYGLFVLIDCPDELSVSPHFKRRRILRGTIELFPSSSQADDPSQV